MMSDRPCDFGVPIQIKPDMKTEFALMYDVQWSLAFWLFWWMPIDATELHMPDASTCSNVLCAWFALNPSPQLKNISVHVLPCRRSWINWFCPAHGKELMHPQIISWSILVFCFVGFAGLDLLRPPNTPFCPTTGDRSLPWAEVKSNNVHMNPAWQMILNGLISVQQANLRCRELQSLSQTKEAPFASQSSVLYPQVVHCSRLADGASPRWWYKCWQWNPLRSRDLSVHASTTFSWLATNFRTYFILLVDQLLKSQNQCKHRMLLGGLHFFYSDGGKM